MRLLMDVALITFSADAESLNFVCAIAPPSAAYVETLFVLVATEWRRDLKIVLTFTRKNHCYLAAVVVFVTTPQRSFPGLKRVPS